MNRRWRFTLLLMILVAIGSLLPADARLLPWYRPDLAHVLVYAVLAFLIGWSRGAGRGGWWFGLSVAAVFGLGVEGMQSFMPTREARLDDALLNLAGAALGALALLAFEATRKRIVRTPKHRS